MALAIRPMGERDREAIFSWAAGLGWNPGIRDGECLHATDPDGLFLAELEGAPVGCATAIAYDATFGFIGALMVNPALRGQGYGSALQRHVLDYLGDRNIGLDAMASTREHLLRCGFHLAYRHLRFEGIIGGDSPDSSIVPLSEVPFADICACDAACFPVIRERFLRHWLDAYGAGGFACLRNGRLAGFGVLRPAVRGFRAGPILAGDAETAEKILKAMGTMSGGATVALDVPEPNASAVAIAERLGLERGFDTARLYSRVIPELPLERLFGIASYEFG
ncbi:MAG: GNAT family N-acetyltransferase [Syntrophobacteraceae bacterium]